MIYQLKKFSSCIFLGNLHDQKDKGNHKSRGKPSLARSDIKKIYINYFIPHYDNDPRCLQQKVYFEIAYFLGKYGQEGFRTLKKDSFAIKKNSENRIYQNDLQ